MFIRIKNVKNKKGRIYPYAYLVSNKWYKRGFGEKGKGSRQKVVKYLGRVYSFSKVKDEDFFGYLKINNTKEYLKNKKNKIIKDLVRWELHRYGVDLLKFDVDFTSIKVTKSGRDVSLKLNEGLLNTYSLRKLINFKFTGEEREDGVKLATCFVEAGIEVPSEVFVGIFDNVYS